MEEKRVLHIAIYLTIYGCTEAVKTESYKKEQIENTCDVTERELLVGGAQRLVPNKLV